MQYTRCEACKGKKTILGLGAIERKCHVCGGVGQVKIECEIKVKQSKLKKDTEQNEVA